MRQRPPVLPQGLQWYCWGGQYLRYFLHIQNSSKYFETWCAFASPSIAESSRNWLLDQIHHGLDLMPLCLLAGLLRCPIAVSGPSERPELVTADRDSVKMSELASVADLQDLRRLVCRCIELTASCRLFGHRLGALHLLHGCRFDDALVSDLGLVPLHQVRQRSC